MKKLTKTDNLLRYEHQFSLLSDPYLESHRLKSTAFVPFVMGLEYFSNVVFQLCDINHLKSKYIVFTNYIINNGIFLRKDRNKTVNISVEKNNKHNENNDGFCIKFFQNNDFEYFSSDINFLSDINFFFGVCCKNNCYVADCENNLEKKIVKSFDKNIYGSLLPHGPHFQSKFECFEFESKKAKCKIYDFKNELYYFESKKLYQLDTNPALLDSVLQFCAIHLNSFENSYILPVGVEKLILNKKLLPDTCEAHLVIKKINKSNEKESNNVIYNANLFDKNNKVLAIFNHIKFKKIINNKGK